MVLRSAVRVVRKYDLAMRNCDAAGMLLAASPAGRDDNNSGQEIPVTNQRSAHIDASYGHARGHGVGRACHFPRTLLATLSAHERRSSWLGNGNQQEE
jgi:hypothetical protein